MRILSKWPVLLLLVVGVSVVAAQPSEPTVAPPTASVETLRASVAKLEVDVKAHVQHVNVLRAQARKSQDVIKLSCINDVLVQLKAELNMFDTNRHALEQSFDDGRSDEALFAKVSTHASSIRQLREEADACFGTVELSSTDALVDAPDILDDPTQDDDLTPETGIEPPAYASPYR